MKRFLSMVLSLVMVLSLIPAVFATGEMTEKTYVLYSSEISGGAQFLSYVKAYGDDSKTWGWQHFGYSEGVEESDSSTDKYLGYVGSGTNGLLFNLYDRSDKQDHLTFALSLQAPSASGFYIPSTRWSPQNSNATLTAYMRKKGSETAVAGYAKSENLIFTDTAATTGGRTASSTKAIYTTATDELIAAYDLGSSSYKFYNIRLTPISNPTMTISVDEETMTASVTVSGKASFYNSTNKNYDDPIDVSMPVSNSFITYSSDNAGVAAIDPKTGVITLGGGYGTATISAETSDGVECSVEYEVEEPAPEKTDLEIAFELDGEEDITSSYTAPSVTGLDITGDVITPVDNGNGTYTLEAPEKNDDGDAFLYWAKGMQTKKRIISFDRVINDYVPAENGRNYLIAVYEGDITDTADEYYNLNGQLIAKQETAPALPSIPGLGTAEGWESCGGNIFVAKYADTTPEANIAITAGDNCSLNKNTKYAYGEEVICTATGTGTFKCWKKNGEIVSIDESYSFRAWENCTVEAVYEDYYYTGSTMKILIDSFDIDTGVTGIMAEFIGFDDADVVEKGIMFTATDEEAIKIPMTTTDNQLTVVADEAGKYAGYAILRNESAYTLITDGSITISDIAE